MDDPSAGLERTAYQDLVQLVVRDVRQLRAVVLGDDELGRGLAVWVSGDAGGERARYGNGWWWRRKSGKGLIRTAWPILSGLMSRKARVLSDSKIFIEGISPLVVYALALEVRLEDESRRGMGLPLMILQNMQEAAIMP
jgi:hypothetical protein